MIQYYDAVVSELYRHARATKFYVYFCTTLIVVCALLHGVVLLKIFIKYTICNVPRIYAINYSLRNSCLIKRFSKYISNIGLL